MKAAGKPDPPAAATRRRAGRTRSVEALWYAALLLLVFLLGCFNMTNGDIWWHLRTGQLIWQRGHVPRTDWYTYTNPDAEWIDLHWGFQLAAAGLWALGGSAALILAKSLLGAATLGVCLTIGRREWPKWQTVGIWLAPSLIFAGRYYVRPEIVSMLLLSSTLAILYHAPRHPRLVWLLPLVQLVWVNVQGLFVLQLVVLACFLIDGAARRVGSWCAGRREPARLGRWPAWIAFALTPVACLANPYGLRGTLFPLVLFQRVQGPHREFFQQYSGEFQGFDDFVREYGVRAVFTTLTTCLLVLVVVGAVVTFALLLARRRVSVYRALLFGAFGYLAWQMSRNSVPFALVAGVVLRLNLGELTDLTELARAPEGRGGRPAAGAAPSHPRLAQTLVGLCLLLLMVSVPSGVYYGLQPARMGKRFGLGQAGWYGHRAAEFLRQPGTPGHVCAWHAGQAAVCIYHLAPEKRVFADGRLEVNTQQTLTRYHQIPRQLAAGDPRAEANLRRGIAPMPDGRRELPALVFANATLIDQSASRPGLMQGLSASGRWRCVFMEPTAEQFARNPPALMDGTTVFFEQQYAQQHGFAEVDFSHLRQAAYLKRHLLMQQRGRAAPKGH